MLIKFHALQTQIAFIFRVKYIVKIFYRSRILYPTKAETINRNLRLSFEWEVRMNIIIINLK